LVWGGEEMKPPKWFCSKPVFGRCGKCQLAEKCEDFEEEKEASP